jgi:hypothetical protein
MKKEHLAALVWLPERGESISRYVEGRQVGVIEQLVELLRVEEHLEQVFFHTYFTI